MPAPSTPSRYSRSLGALLALHAGDSLGATLEFCSHASIETQYPSGLRDIVGGGMFHWPAGHATDDTDLTRAVCLAYRDRHRHVQAQQRPRAQKELGNVNEQLQGSNESMKVVDAAAAHMLTWFDGSDWPSRKPGSRPVDVGGATAQSLSTYAASRSSSTSGAGPGSAGNGSLMRCVPTALLSSPTSTQRTRIDESMRISAITHNDVRCTVSCAAYNEIVFALVVRNMSPCEAVHVGIHVARDVLECPSVAEAIERGTRIPLRTFAEEGPSKEFPDRTSGFVLQSLSLAVAAVLDERSLEDVLVDVVRIGGDTDTNGAIAGALLGARDGMEGVPLRWMKKLQFAEEFEKIVREVQGR